MPWPAQVSPSNESPTRGRIEIDAFPQGVIAIDCATTSKNAHYYGQVTLTHVGSRSITVVLRHATDVVKGVSPAVLGQAAETRPTLEQWDEDQRRGRDAQAFKQLSTHRPLDTMDPRTSTSIRTTTGQTETTIERSGALLVPKGTKEVYVSYEVVTAEYPRYLDPRYAFDDVWTLSVMSSGGERVFYVRRNVTSQAEVSPIWQDRPGYQSTGGMIEVLDVKALAAKSDVQLTLVATALNVRDDLVLTIVHAALGTTWPTRRR